MVAALASPMSHTETIPSLRRASTDSSLFSLTPVRGRPRVATDTRPNLLTRLPQKGPRNTEKHSKWPIFLQMHGSIMPRMILPLVSVAAWTTLFTCIHELVTPIGISSILLTVLGFVVGLGLSFRSSTAYERYNEGRRYWAQLVLSSQNLARIFWVHAKEREGKLGKQDLLAKLYAPPFSAARATS